LKDFEGIGKKYTSLYKFLNKQALQQQHSEKFIALKNKLNELETEIPEQFGQNIKKIDEKLASETITQDDLENLVEYLTKQQQRSQTILSLKDQFDQLTSLIKSSSQELTPSQSVQLLHEIEKYIPLFEKHISNMQKIRAILQQTESKQESKSKIIQQIQSKLTQLRVKSNWQGKNMEQHMVELTAAFNEKLRKKDSCSFAIVTKKLQQDLKRRGDLVSLLKSLHELLKQVELDSIDQQTRNKILSQYGSAKNYIGKFDLYQSKKIAINNHIKTELENRNEFRYIRIYSCHNKCRNECKECDY
jgi:chromosome segregation ATPase